MNYTDNPYGLGDAAHQMSSWGGLPMHQPAEAATSQPTSTSQNVLPLSLPSEGSWNQPSCGEILDFQGLDTEGPIGQAYTTDETVPIIDLRFSNQQQDSDNLDSEGRMNKRRFSGSSLAVSSCEPLSDIPSSYDDFPATMSEAPSYASEYLPTSNRTSLMSSIHQSPVASPRATSHNRPDQVRTQSRGRASPSPRPSARSAPYSIEGSNNQRWSTGSYAPMQNRRYSPLVYHNHGQDGYGPNQRMSLQNYPPNPSGPTSVHMGSFHSHQHSHQHQHPHLHHQPYYLPGQPAFPRHTMILQSQLPHQNMFEQPPPLPSQGLFKMLQSNGDAHTLHGHYTDLSDPPDLFAALKEEQIPPPEEDMNPSDSNLIPYEQALRFEGDLYTPKWVRGHGNKREGWCGICKPGRWLVLKNSAFWYDKSFTHGISAATGSPFEEPLDTRRMDGNPDVWEGLCGSCNDWIPLVSSKKKGTTWFRHAYKCHTHQKVKDTPKRRRETNCNKNSAGQSARPKTEATTPHTPVTPQVLTPASSLNTPTTMSAPQLQLKVLHQQKQMYQNFTSAVPTSEPYNLPGSQSLCMPGTASMMENMI
ncbi:hypothetical protein C2857_006475 [Epichloe festucae Fl1]|uniref:Transcription regulator Rua1 C-terminal domain-containing protein n=1 Tax=Epichloe festucae (strain Fl1) TaxID=877507 RepID=A0A7S9KTI2_EPIFF|nr:hypothetical protein C2857_006475 [Epichloe festucae Fl1]